MFNTELITYINKTIKELSVDLRAEVIVAYMNARGASQDDIIISPLSLFRRKFTRDLEAISMLETKSGKEYLQVKLNREGIYDSLPEAITHIGKKPRSRGIKTTDDMIDEVKIRRKEEKAARLFFQPFENEFYHQLVDLEVEEQNILRGFVTNSRYSTLLNNFWQIPEVLDPKQKAIFIYLIPLIHKAAANLKLSKLCYEAILGATVNFNINYYPGRKVDNPNSVSDSNLKLGVNFVCGEKIYSSQTVLEIIIGPIPDKQIPDFLPGGRGKAVIEFLNEYFIEAGLDTKIILKAFEEAPQPALQDFRLGYIRL